MAHITFITGGQRSGKSRYAQNLAEQVSDAPIYLATSRIWDNDFKQRVKRHQNDRGNQWTTVEEEKFLSKHTFHCKTVLLDCITLWLTNFYTDTQFDVNQSLTQAQKEWAQFIEQDMNLIVVSNELGMGVHPETEAARKFADLQGWMNQTIAKHADKVFLMISGIHLQIK